MIYVDTNVVVAFVNPRDPLHGRARGLLGGFRGRGPLVVSELVVVELYSVYSRVVGVSGVELEALVEYSLRVTGVERRSVDWDVVLELAREYAGLLRLRTLDLLHVTAARVMGADALLTLDRGVLGRRDAIREALGLEVYGGEDG